MFRALVVCWCAVACLAGCAIPPPVAADDAFAVLDDKVFMAQRSVPDPERILALSPEMREFLKGPLGNLLRLHGPLNGFVRAIAAGDQLHIDYDPVRTRTAAETFADHAGNCLSLVLMTAAMANELGLDVQYHRVLTADVEVADENLIRLVGHVNLSLQNRGASRVANGVTIDFLPPPEARRLPFEIISEDRVKSMYFNNKAVEALSDGELGQAYWWARASILMDSQYHSAYITLGAIWEHSGRQELAQAALKWALLLDPGNPNGESNLRLAESGGQPSGSVGERALSAAALRLPLRLKSAAARTAFPMIKRGDWVGARVVLEQALPAQDSTEIHLMLAAVYDHLGNSNQSADQVQAAARQTSNAAGRALLESKVAALRRAAAEH